MSDKEKTIDYLEGALDRLEKQESVIYFLVYDTKDNARAAVKNIYDMALILRENGFNSKILVEDNEYTGVKGWLGDTYDDVPIVSIKEDKVEIRVDDTIVVPEQYSNILAELSNINCNKLMLVQQKDFIFETLPIGSRWSQYGFEKCITTTDTAKKYIREYFPESLVYTIPPYIGDHFKPSEKPTKPLVAISCRDRSVQRRIISEFYLKFPHLRWITFRDMVQMTYEDFAVDLSECMVSVWVDDESTFGTFPLESMKCGVPVIGKIPHSEPDWLDENGFWTYDGSKIVDLIGAYILSWLDGVELEDDVKTKMDEAYKEFTKENHSLNTLSVFNTIHTQKIETINKNLETFKGKEE
jgi:glycosyltransferase involved in cell wall biosynthesis